MAAKVVLDFDAMEVHGDCDAGDGIRAEEEFVILADVEEFDGENVGGLAQLFFGEELRRRLVELTGPPVDDASEAGEVGGFAGFQYADEIQVGLLVVIFAASCRTIEHNGLEIVSGGFAQTAGEFG